MLARRLEAEDQDEEAGRLSPDNRLTCHVHQRWIHQCVASPVHVHPVTRHRWCRASARPLTVVIDVLACTVAMTCPACGAGSSAATTRLVAACRASLGITSAARLTAVAA